MNMSAEDKAKSQEHKSPSHSSSSSRDTSDTIEELKTWEDPIVLVPEGPFAPGPGCSNGDNYYVKCDSGSKGDL